MDTTILLPLYSYVPLAKPESIRILVLHPSEDHLSPLRCDLVHDDRDEILLDLEQDRGYEAVSYAWGDPIFSHEIVCSGGTAKVAITRDVDSLLRHLRKKGRTRRLWIDAICLNQEDHDEKRIQVGLMGEIYRQARKVHVWLLDETEARTTMDPAGLPLLHKNIPKLIALFKVLSIASDKRDWKFFRKYAARILEGDDQFSTLLVPFLQAPWFQRRWTIQEAAVNACTTVRYGSLKMSWTQMKNALNMLNTTIASHELTTDALASSALYTALAIRSQPETILSLLFRYHTAQCLDPRDRIAALWSMAIPNRSQSETSARLPVDYNLSWEDNYYQFTLQQIKDGNVGEVFQHLRLFGTMRQIDTSHPSWVPDWSQCRPHNVRDIENFHPNSRHNPQPPSVTDIDGLPALTLELRKHTTVDHVFPSSEGTDGEKLEKISSRIYASWSAQDTEHALTVLFFEAVKLPLSTTCEIAINNTPSIKRYATNIAFSTMLKHDIRTCIRRDVERKSAENSHSSVLSDVLEIYTIFTGLQTVGDALFVGLASCEVRSGDLVVSHVSPSGPTIACFHCAILREREIHEMGASRHMCMLEAVIWFPPLARKLPSHVASPWFEDGLNFRLGMAPRHSQA